MEVLNLLKNTVANVLPGNPISREIEIGSHRASAGSGLLWKIYDGITRNTKQEVSVFLFEKKNIEKYSKRDREIIVEMLRKGVSQLTRLRHPKILSVLHPLEESRESLAFATEPVLASLANILGQFENVPNPVPADIKDYKLFDVEIKYGLLQVIEGLAFLHNDAKRMHGNICPESIVFNRSGAWKLAGFDFSIAATTSSEASKPFYAFHEWDTELPPSAQPNLNYLAPEYALTASCDAASDLYSVGMLFYAVCNNGHTLYDCHGQYSSFKRSVTELRGVKPAQLESIPVDVREHVQLLLNVEPTLRPDAHQLSKIPFFEDLGAKTLQYLDSLFQQDNIQKSQFFKGLPQVISVLPKRVNLFRVLPCLIKECINPPMVPFILPSLLLIVEQTTDMEYVKYLLPELIPLFKIQDPIQVTYIFMQNMNLLLGKTPQADVRNHVLPMVYRALEADMPQMQEICLSIIPTFAQLIEYASLKKAIVPRIRKVCLQTTSLQLRVNCLICLGKLLEYMDKWYVLDDIFPFLPEITSREPAVLMSILGIYKVTLNHKKLGITKDVLATKVLPFLIPLSIDSNLNLSQYNAFAATIREMLSKVEAEQQAKLEQLQTMQQEQKSLQFITEPVQSVRSLVSGVEGPKQDTLMDEFMNSFGFTSTNGVARSAKNDKGNVSSNNASHEPSTVQELTLEEKQRLAKSQSEQQRLKSQASSPMPTAPSSAVKMLSTISSGTSNDNKPKAPKDLSSMLLASDMMSSSRPARQQQQQQPQQMMNGGPSGMSSSAGTSSTMSNTSSWSQNTVGIGMLSLTGGSGYNPTSTGVLSPTGGSQNLAGTHAPLSTISQSQLGNNAIMPGNLAHMSNLNSSSSAAPLSTNYMTSQTMFGLSQPNSSMMSLETSMSTGASLQKPAVDLSAFDSLNPFGGQSKQTVPANIARQNIASNLSSTSSGSFNMPQPGASIPYQPVTGIAHQPTMMTNRPPMMMMTNNSAMNSQPPMMQPRYAGNVNMMGLSPSQVNSGGSSGDASKSGVKLSNKDIADFLG